MRYVFVDSEGRLRNGWWALAFVAVFLGLGLVQRAVVTLLTSAGLPRGVWVHGVGVTVILTATWVCTRLRREPLASVGLRLDGRWARELGLGVVLGVGQMIAAAFMIWAVGGVSLALDPDRSLQALAIGTLVFVCVAIKEEVLFRGFLFQRLRDGLGTWPAQLLLAALFALGHWGNPGMEGATRIWATVDTGIGALVLGLAWLRTRSLALPLGIHFGWNWMQGTVLGFAVSGTNAHGLFRPTLLGQADWMTGGAFGVEASVFAVLVDTTALVLLLAWKGSVPAPDVAQA